MAQHLIAAQGINLECFTAAESVTQLVDNTDGVDISSLIGRITMFEPLLANEVQQFSVGSDRIRAESVVFCGCETLSATGGIPVLVQAKALDGSFEVTIKNLDAANPTDGPAVVTFRIFFPKY